MPFLPQEGRFLRARRAYTRTQNITRWLLVGYILGCRRWYMRILRVVSLVGCKDFSSFCWLLSGREVVWEVMPVGLLVWSMRSFFFHAGEFFLSQSAQSSLSIFAHSFDPTEGLRHTEFTEASPPAPLRMERGVVCEVTPFGLLLIGNGPLNIWRTRRGISVITPLSIRRGAGGEASVAVRFCEIGWLNVSVERCVFCSSVFFCERKYAPTLWDKTHENRWGVFSLTERTEFTEHFYAQFRAHKRVAPPPTPPPQGGA